MKESSPASWRTTGNCDASARVLSAVEPDAGAADPRIARRSANPRAKGGDIVGQTSAVKPDLGMSVNSSATLAMVSSLSEPAASRAGGPI
jgi:hypothetical protein